MAGRRASGRLAGAGCRAAGLLLLGALLPALNGCASPAYYAQAMHGHWALMRARQPVAEALADPATPAPLKQQLALALAAREFAVSRLGLPDNGSYLSYVPLARSHVVWTVFAAPALALSLRRSCFLVLGCLDYRGYFSQVAANDRAAHLRARGDDVYVGGVAAYSSLGWFDDPLVSPMLRWEEPTLVRTLFHELAHQVVYVAGDTSFNESFAMAVAEAGLVRWWQHRHPGAPAPDDVAREEAFIALVLGYRDELAAVYESPLPSADKLARKQDLLAALRDEFARRAGDWPDRDDYARWLAQDLNNAKLASVATYHTWVPAFRVLLDRARGDLPAFYASCRELGALPSSRRAAALQALLRER